MSDKNSLSAEIKIKSVEYSVNLSITSQNDGLEIELRRNETGETWKGTFESTYIEELTKKTGNFKSFPIFVNMLKTALKQVIFLKWINWNIKFYKIVIEKMKKKIILSDKVKWGNSDIHWIRRIN